ncbi:MAG: PD-(D/E)XK nuclease family protein [Oscillospiraceae bacterium]
MDNIVLQNLSGIERFSYSKLSTYETCPYSYWLNYIQKIKGIKNGFGEAGSSVHSVIEEYYKNNLSQYEILALFEQKWNDEFLDKGFRVQLILPTFTRDMTDKYHDTFVNYFNNFKAYDYFTIGKKKIHCNIIGVEKKYDLLIQTPLKKIIFTGLIDGLGITDDGEYVIWDSKSKAKWKDQEELNNYAKQLYIYALFIKTEFGKFPKYLCFNQFRLPEKDRVTVIEFNKNVFEKTIQWMFSVLEKIEKDTLFLPTCEQFFADNLCNFRDCCEYSLKKEAK